MARMRAIDLNADVGEIDASIDAELIPLLTSASIACGGHAGTEESMRRTVAIARQHGVQVGAHPGYRDREHFGRRPLQLERAEVVELIRSQVAALEAVATAEGAALRHVKVHGALYNQAERDPDLAAAVVSAVVGYPRPLLLVGRAGSAMEDAARRAGAAFAREAFADRRYLSDGSLKPRSQPGAVIESVDEVAEQVRRLCTRREVVADDGSVVRVAFETLCVHSDTPGSAGLARRVRAELAAICLSLRPL
jgi:UPF0271 protein